MADHTSYLATAKRVIATQARALDQLSNAVPAGLADAVQMILATQGRVIVTGVGKSGHIAHKIAATLASTGTPAHFVHPSEASHGDLGVVRKGDIVLAISNSGEAPELADIVAYASRFDIPLIGLSSNADSALMTQADVHLLIPQLGEACGHNVVPTNSTTMSLALGDALAVALMEARAFTPENFRDFHPGGKLGARLSKVSDLMHSADAVPLVQTTDDMKTTLAQISAKGFGVVGVQDANGGLAGIITDGDLRRNLDGLMQMSPTDIMTKQPQTVSPHVLAEEAVAVMNARKITCLFAVDDGKIAGILHIHDCLRAGLG